MSYKEFKDYYTNLVWEMPDAFPELILSSKTELGDRTWEELKETFMKKDYEKSGRFKSLQPKEIELVPHLRAAQLIKDQENEELEPFLNEEKIERMVRGKFDKIDRDASGSITLDEARAQAIREWEGSALVEISSEHTRCHNAWNWVKELADDNEIDPETKWIAGTTWAKLYQSEMIDGYKEKEWYKGMTPYGKELFK